MGVVLPKDDVDDYEDPLAELTRLAKTAGANILGAVTQRRNAPDPAYFIGKGKVLDLAELAHLHQATVIISDNDLTPAQIRNIEKVVKVKVVDRTELILDIFATRAQTKQAKLQVELAQLEYLLPRLRRMWTHLERIEGGIGTVGPGEKQLEVDRRLVRKRISDLRRDLKEIEARKKREVARRHDFFQASLVGYTNAGKSTLMNRLTRAGVEVEDKLFSTLDTCTRQWTISRGRSALLSDTVGFIKRLPHHLVASFHATLEEANQADLLLHVVDASHPKFEDHIAAVNQVLEELELNHKPRLLVFNKSDAVQDTVYVHATCEKMQPSVLVSATTGEGMEDLRQSVMEIYERSFVEAELSFNAGDGKLFSTLAKKSEILRQDYEGSLIRMRTRIDKRFLEQLIGENHHSSLEVAAIE